MHRRIPAATLALATLACLACTPTGTYIERRPAFGTPTAVTSPHDEDGGRFDGARISPGFGILYRNGYTAEAVDESGCGGYFADEPEHILEVGYAMRLKLVVQAEDALVMRVITPNGETICGDPPGVVNENLSLTRHLRPGSYEVWVGATEQQTSSSYRLVLSE